MIELLEFKDEQAEQAMQLAQENYEEERGFVPTLPQIAALPELAYFAHSGYGCTAFENGRMVGFLCFFQPSGDAFGTTGVKGTFSPIHAHGAAKENRGRIYALLYQAVADKLVKDGILSHAVALYTHDAAAKDSFFQNGFGLRCVDAVRALSPIEPVEAPLFDFVELSGEKKGMLTELRNLLILHLGGSPCFMPFPQKSEAEITAEKESEDNRYFAALIGNKAVAYIKIGDDGENFACECPQMLNICGACCLPDYRGTGLYQNLLSCVIKKLGGEGYTHLGVDFESFNPTARGFWLKHFAAYTGSVVRRVDDKMLRV
jgi:hypothetical protein